MSYKVTNVPVPAAAAAATFLLFGDGSDGDVTTSGTVTLTRNMYYRSLNVPSGATLIAAGFRIHVAQTMTVGGTVRGTAVGANPVNIAQVIASSALVIGGPGGTGGFGGSVGTAGATSPGAGSAGPASGTANNPRALLALLGGGVTGGTVGGTGGLGGGYNPGSGGQSNNIAGNQGDATLGSGGLGGGALAIFAYALEGNGLITTAGAAGRVGANGYTQASGDRPYFGGNGGGGGGGGGGILLVLYKARAATLTLSTTGGAGGAGGAAGPSSTAGSTGSTGTQGTVMQYVLAS